MICKECQTEYPDNDLFCPKCGVPSSVVTQNASRPKDWSVPTGTKKTFWLKKFACPLALKDVFVPMFILQYAIISLVLFTVWDINYSLIMFFVSGTALFYRSAMRSNMKLAQIILISAACVFSLKLFLIVIWFDINAQLPFIILDVILAVGLSLLVFGTVDNDEFFIHKSIVSAISGLFFSIIVTLVLRTRIMLFSTATVIIQVIILLVLYAAMFQISKARSLDVVSNRGNLIKQFVIVSLVILICSNINL